MYGVGGVTTEPLKTITLRRRFLMQSVDSRSLTRTGRGAVLALAALAAAGCADQDVTEPTPAPSFSVIQQSANLFETFGALGPAWGTATIRPGQGGVQVQLRVTDPVVQAALEGNAITIWVASFHDPSECAAAPDICGPGDLAVPSVGAALQRGGGSVLGNGPINLAVNVREGDNSEQIAGTAVGLLDAAVDEIHVVIRSHGAPIPGKVDAQIHTPAGGCKTVNGNPGPDPAGNDCVDVAVAIFK